MNIKRSVVIVIACCLLIHLFAGGILANPITDFVFETVKRPVGFIHLPRCDNPELLVSLAAAAPNARIHAQHPDADVVARARDILKQSGLLNRRVYIDQCDLSRLLPVGNIADLIVMTDLTAVDLTPELAREIKRVLHPWFGKAVLSGAVSEDELLHWARSFGTSDCECRITKSAADSNLPECWLTVRKSALRGADDWTHWWHGPDNNAVSTDTAFAGPESLQWTGKPFFSTRLELPIVCDGRVFVLWNGHLLDTTPGEAVLPGEETAISGRGLNWAPDVPLDTLRGPLLTAQAAGSGVRLWSRRLSPASWLQVARSTMVADSGCLLVADGSDVLELDQATGEELRRTEVDGEEIRWMAAVGGILAILSGPTTQNTGRRTEALVVPFRSSGLHLTVLNRRTFDKRWQIDREAGNNAFDPRSPAIADGRLFICTEDSEAAAFRITDGEVLWRTDTRVERQPPQSYEWDRLSRHPVTGYAAAGLYLLTGPEVDRCIALSQEEGRPMWEPARGAGAVGPIPLAFDDLVWIGSQGFRPTTGDFVKRLGHLDSGGCSRLTASPQGIFGTCGLVWNRASSETCESLPAKSSCAAGTLAANGLIWKFPSACPNCTEWRGFIVRSSREDTPPAPARVVSVDGGLPTGEETKGWTTHRADANRSASLDVALPHEMEIIWQTTGTSDATLHSSHDKVMLGAEFVPAPPVVVGDIIIVAGADGIVEALAVDSGKQLWRAFTSGRIYSSPTVWRDRVFIACADGYLYAIRLTDGSELWRGRVAPQVGRTAIFNQLGSRWPALGSPLVVGDQVFATAGMLDGIDGIYCTAFDAASGKVLWETNHWKPASAEGILSGAGQLCGGHDLIFHGGEAPLVRISPSEGSTSPGYVLPTEEGSRKLGVAARNVQGVYRCSKGQDVGAITPQWTVFGGRRMFIDQAEDGQWRCNLMFLHSTIEGVGKLPVIAANDAVLLPAWDEKDILIALSDRRNDGIAIAPKNLLLESLTSKLDEDIPPTGLSTIQRSITLGDNQAVRWRHQFRYRERVIASALTRESAIVVIRQKDAGKVFAFDRKSGTIKWETELPGSPIYDGMAIGMNGSVVIALRDGSILCLGGKLE